MKPASFLVSLLGVCLLLNGCASVPKASGIIVSVAGFRPVVTSPVPNRAILTLRFTSENVNAVGISSSSHQLYLNGTYVGKAENSSPIGVPPLGTMTQDVTIDLENTGAVREALAVSDPATAGYRLESVLRFTDIDEKYQLKSSFEGRVALHGLEAAAR